MISHVKYHTNYIDRNMNYENTEDTAVGFLGQINGNVYYFYGGYNEDVASNYWGLYDGQSVSGTVPYGAIANGTNVADFLNECKNYIVNVEHKLTSAQYDTMVSGVLAWANDTDYKFYHGTITVMEGFGLNNLEIEIMSGTKKLKDSAEAHGFHTVGQVVDNIFIVAYKYSALTPDDRSDSALEFASYDSIKQAVEAEYITDPDIIDFIEDNSWDEITETRCDWTINIDGTKHPDITVMWNAPGITSGDIDSGSAVINMEMLLHGTPPAREWANLGTFSYDKHVYKTSWNKLASQSNIPAYQKLLANIPIVGQYIDTNVAIRFHVTYYINGGMQVTSTAWATIDYEGGTNGGIDQPRDGSTIRFTHSSTDEAIEEFLDDIDLDNLDDPTVTDPTLDQAFSGVGLLTKTYVITKARLQSLGTYLWSRDFFDFIQDLNASPIENIVSVKMVPFDIPCGNDTEIVIGNVGTGILGGPVDINYNCKHTIGTVNIAKKYPTNCNFLNSNTFTKLSLFLPFIGFKELDASLFLDHTLKVEYINDIITGNCKAVIYADNVPICDFSGQIGLDIPISSTNRAQVEQGLISAVGQGMASIASGNIGGAISSALSVSSNAFHTETRGANSPSCDSFMTHDCFYILENAIVQYPSRYNHTHGRPLNLSKTLRNVTGFTVCEDVDVSGIQGATKEELDYIKEMLESGVYL